MPEQSEPEWLLSMRQDFLLTTIETLEDLRANISSKSSTEIARILHNLKGAGATYSVPIISEIAHRIEDFIELSENLNTQNFVAAVGVLILAAQRSLAGKTSKAED